MKAVVCTKYGPPEGLALEEVPKPTPNDNDRPCQLSRWSGLFGGG